MFFFITQFPSLITHHFKYYTHLAPSLNFHHSIFFTLFVGPIPVTHCRLFFFCTKKKKREKKPRTDQSERKKKKKKKKRTNPKQTEVKKIKKRTEQPTRRRKEKKKSKVVKSCGWVLFVVPYMCLITILSLSYELWKLKIAKMCF